MDIDDAPLECAQKIALQNAHETGEHNQIHPRILQRGDKCAFRILVQLGAKFSRRNELCGYFPVARARQNAGALDIAQDDGGFRRDFSGGDGVGDGDKIRAFAGTEDADAKCAVHRDLNSRARLQNKLKGAARFVLLG